MPGYTESYNRNTGLSVLGGSRYNPETKVYYGSDGAVVRVEESWGGESWVRTISGSNYAQQWPDYTTYEVISAWSNPTIS
jgi:hypothetical protein